MFIDRMCPEGPGTNNYETEDLEKGDIPYFLPLCGRQIAVLFLGERNEGIFQGDGPGGRLKRKRAMNGSDRKRQEGLIQNIF